MPYTLAETLAPLASESLTAHNLRDLVDGFIEALFFAETPDDERDAWANAELAPEALARIIADCVSFAYSARPWFGDNATMEQIGHDFLLTRNGHGAGFWDRENLYDAPGSTGVLSRIAQGYGQVEPYLGDDGRIYV